MKLLSVLIAPDKFRGSMTAGEAAAAIAVGVHASLPGTDVLLRPIADGGEGTVEAFLAAGWQPLPVAVRGPVGEPVQATIARADQRAVVELADCCGMPRLGPAGFAPREATSAGVGDAIAAAARGGAREIVVALGGSVSTDGGIGMIGALGVRVLDSSGAELPATPASLARAATLDASTTIAELRGARLIFATDVTNPLTGPRGASPVFAPQKGATTETRRRIGGLARCLGRSTAHPYRRGCGRPPGAGAAGGVAAGALGALDGVCDVRIVSGAELVLDATGAGTAARVADLVIVGEGSLDAQSLEGKAAITLAGIAAAAGRPVLAVAGRITVSTDELCRHGVLAAVALRELTDSDEQAMSGAVALAATATAKGIAELQAAGHLTAPD